ncbi:cobalamin B12-binding domain-containing protein [Methylobacterium sp. NEAU 140]|uniref:cobalamin B12-binding domain-containing protein n=1 Tax=Methylobacterium sp. NEAU 140 TaxID=3064945 RepID=UPI002735D18A|nr:cobalamin B12-binding domain-containing protein [Methylobacterium sp. NEAU 140]MDP4025416.1 cobalamin B12-binding domain-containing protein [Methylobacterium sp. NEAU 140]
MRDWGHVVDCQDSPPDWVAWPVASAAIDDAPGLHAACHAPGALFRLVEAEILPRLMLAHADGPDRPAATRRPSPDETARFSALLLAPGPVDLDAEVRALLDGGLPLPTLLLDLLAPAARHLGVLWEEDASDFLAVTEGLGRLQAITRRLCDRLEGDPAESGRSILLAPSPGETHGYGLALVASFFREAGWQARVAGGEASAEILQAMLAEGWYDALGLSLSCDVYLPGLRAAIPALRRASRNPALRVIVGGTWFARTGADAGAVGADACALDGRLAPGIAEALLDNRRLAC